MRLSTLKGVNLIKLKILFIIILAVLLLTSACTPISDVALRPRSDDGESNSSGSQEDENDPDGGNLPEQSLFIPDESEDGAGESNASASTGFDNLFGEPLLSSPATISSPYGACYNLSGDIFLYGKKADERVYPSGAAKLLTALTAYNSVSSDFIFKVGKETDMVQAGSGVAGLKEEQELGLEAILTALLIPVGNDAAYTISVNTARALSNDYNNAGNNEMNDYFIRLMNNYAQNLGCQNSNFSNPDGYHASNNYSTVRDLTVISAAAAKNPLISGICGKKEHQVTFASGEEAEWSSNNGFLTLDGWDIRGLKIGYTDESSFSAQVLAYINGSEYIITVSGSDTAAQRERDVIRLLELARDGADNFNEDVISVYED